MGIPIEESVLQLVPAGAAMITAAAIAGRTGLGRLRRRLRHRSPVEGDFRPWEPPPESPVSKVPLRLCSGVDTPSVSTVNDTEAEPS